MEATCNIQHRVNKLEDVGQTNQHRETQMTCAQRGELWEIEHSSFDSVQVVPVGLIHGLYGVLHLLPKN